MSKIDEKTTLPLSWFAACLLFISSVLLTGAWWVFNVDERLGRIEDKLGIVRIEKPLIDEANAGDR